MAGFEKMTKWQKHFHRTVSKITTRKGNKSDKNLLIPKEARKTTNKTLGYTYQQAVELWKEDNAKRKKVRKAKESKTRADKKVKKSKNKSKNVKSNRHQIF